MNWRELIDDNAVDMLKLAALAPTEAVDIVGWSLFRRQVEGRYII